MPESRPLSHDFWPKTITVCPDCGNHQTGFALCGHQKGDDPSGQVDRSKFVKVEVVPVQPAGPDTVEERLRRALPGAGEGSAEEQEKFHDLVRAVEAREAVVAAVGPVGRPEDHLAASRVAGQIGRIGDWIDRDRREADKVLCHVQSLRRLATDLAQGRESVGRSCEVTDEMREAAVTRYFIWRNRYADPEGEQFDGSEVDYVREMATVLLEAALGAAERQAP